MNYIFTFTFIQAKYLSKKIFLSSYTIYDYTIRYIKNIINKNLKK